MKTRLTTSPEEAAAFIKQGGLAAFPTETVYGLGASVFYEEAVSKIFDAKMRPADNPLIAHIGSLAQIDDLASYIGGTARLLIDVFFPGPLTLVLPKSEKVPLIATAGLNSIGVRMPRNELAREFLTACGVPVAAPSANLSGRPSPTTWEAVYEDLDGRIDCILQGDVTEIGLESTVVDCSGPTPVVLRSGAVTLEQLRAVVPEIGVYSGDIKGAAKSPGMKHKHYAPRAKVIVSPKSKVQSPKSRAGYIGVSEPGQDFALVIVCDSVEEYARTMFEFFRECDRQEIEAIYCEEVEETGIGAALMDRLKRAAE